MPKVVREKEMAVGHGALFRAITDFESYPQFLPEVVGVQVKENGPAKKLVVFELELLKRFQYTLEFQLTGEQEVAWKLVESNIFKVNQGKWALKPLGGERTQVYYEVEVGFGFLVPGWVTKKLTETNLPKMLEGFEEQAKRVESRS